MISGNPAALQLRYLQTLTEIGATQNSTVVFPLPLDIINAFMETTGKTQASEKDVATPELENGARAELPEGTKLSQGPRKRTAVGSPPATQ